MDACATIICALEGLATARLVPLTIFVVLERREFWQINQFRLLDYIAHANFCHLC